MSLKIAYIYFTILPLLGISNKIKHQADAITKAGLNNFDIFVLNPFKQEEARNFYYVKYDTWPGILKYLDYFFRHNFGRYKIIDKYLPLKDYDYLILRYPKADKPGEMFFKKYKVISEHHAKEVTELKLESENANNIAEKIFKYIRYLNEKKYKAKMLNDVRGIIGVTGEIARYQLSKTNKNLKYQVISNGINVDQVNETGFKQFDKKNLHILLVASKYTPWHGIERINESINNYQGAINIKLHLVGDFSKIAATNDNKNIIFHGMKGGKDLDEIFSSVNIAISSMALYVKGITEACPLKIREYIARGIPFICAYRDVDLHKNPPEEKFYLNFPNDDSLIDLNKVIDFVESMNKKNNISKEMRYYASKNLDWPIKIKEYYDFIKEIDENIS